MSATQSQALSTSRRAQVVGEEKKETARSLGLSLLAYNTIPCLGQVLTCLGQRQVKLYTLFRTARAKNHTLSSGTYPYNPNNRLPPEVWSFVYKVN